MDIVASPASGPLGGYEDWPGFLASTPVAASGDADRDALARALGVRRAPARDVVIEREWTHDGVRGRELSWALPFGPRTRAFLLTPAEHDGALPGVLALHCHGGVRSTGAEQLVLTDRAPSRAAARLRETVYDGSAPAHLLAGAGFAVLAHDTFSWGSRAFDLAAPTPRLAHLMAAQEALWAREGVEPDDDQRFDALSNLHEDSLAKTAGLLGTSLAGAVATDDLAAWGVLAGLPEVDAARLAAAGFSGGGGRAALVTALAPDAAAVVIGGMMATFASLVPGFVDTHSWLLNSPGLPQVTDLPDLTGIGGARDVLVQYGTRDPLFPTAGVRDADARLRRIHPEGGYTGTFHDAAHVWTRSMQQEAAVHLARTLGARGAASGAIR